MEKLVELKETQEGKKYFYIYRVVDFDLITECIKPRFFFNKEDAEKYQKMIKGIYSDKYRPTYITKVPVWC